MTKRKLAIGLGTIGMALLCCWVMATAQSCGLIAPSKALPTSTATGPATATGIPQPTSIPTYTSLPVSTYTPVPTKIPEPTEIPKWDREDCIEGCMMLAECWYGYFCPEANAVYVEVQGTEQGVCDYSDAIELLDDEHWDLYQKRVKAFRNLLCPKICDPNVSESDKPYNFVFCVEIK